MALIIVALFAVLVVVGVLVKRRLDRRRAFKAAVASLRANYRYSIGGLIDRDVQ